jgi:hypothetical protein
MTKGDEMKDSETPGLLKPTSDMVFRRLMTQGDDVLKSFLAAALDLKEDELSEFDL